MRARAWAIAALFLFSGVARADLSDQLQELVDKYGAFLNGKTPVGVSDGNPQSATAFLADTTYRHYGLMPRQGADMKNSTDDWLISVNVGAGRLDSGSIDGNYYSAELELATRFSDEVGLSIILPFQYRTIQGTDTYMGGAQVGLPATLVADDGMDGFFWTLTPNLTIASISASEELVQAGWFFGGGLTSSLSYRTGSLVLTMANQAGYDWGEGLSYSNQEIDLAQDISQVVVKNGFGATLEVADALYVDGGITYTNLLNDAFTDGYWTPTAGLTLGLGYNAGIRAGFEGDFADNYTAVGGDLQLFVRF